MTQANGNFWQGQSIRLRALRGSDWEIMLAEEDDSEGIRLFEPGIQLPRSQDMLQRRVQNYIEQAVNDPNPGRFSFIIETLDGQAVGYGNIHGYEARHGTFSFAIRIYRSHRGRGYAKEALRIVLRYGFWELRCQKANSVALASNAASIRLHESLGFQHEGRIRRNIFTDGVYLDEVLFGLTREEFEAQEKKSSDTLGKLPPRV